MVSKNFSQVEKEVEMPTGAWMFSYFALWIMVIFEGAVCILLVRQANSQVNHWVRNDPDWGLPLGSLAPVLPYTDFRGAEIPEAPQTGKLRVLFFVSTKCSACDQIMMRVSPTVGITGVDVILIIHANEEDATLYLTKHRCDVIPNLHVITDPERKIADSYKATVSPFVVVVNSDGRVGAKRSALTLTEIGMLIDSAKVTRG